ncbi:Alpha/Beta hydrolase protein [Sphaerosporella brunnea]|uniref:Alpha/Beta hydrolase protein n=1 Tax=Sphaerosporella brunnea TaxID=1250544 RepID=A0A5J5ERY1_9PEZI|nr:Alpha/Beta hydrolase protein [Sphaerosporella brunnea]
MRLLPLLLAAGSFALPSAPDTSRNITTELFSTLSELSLLVDISYCVNALTPGISQPFSCASFCSQFPSFELITTFHTGLTLSDSCGYIALSHAPSPRRIVVAFRGTYSLANALVDLSFAPQQYIPYPGGEECHNCTVHAGFLSSWEETSKLISPVIASLKGKYEGYELVLLGHSLGGAVAALAALEYHSLGWEPQVTTFGEPRVGNKGLAEFLDARFADGAYRRVTHVNDPVPLLPFDRLGYWPHQGEVFIGKTELPPEKDDVWTCEGAMDESCSAGSGLTVWGGLESHRDYFHRLGLCLPQGGWRIEVEGS